MPDNTFTLYITKPEWTDTLLQELNDLDAEILRTPSRQDLAFIKSTQTCRPAFALDIWQEIEICHIDSIHHAAKILKSHGIFGYHLAVSHRARGALIQNALRKVPDLTDPIAFGAQKMKKLGGFCLLDANTLLFSKKTWKALPGGLISFLENKIDPPNRAYLKLWEALTYLDAYPKPGDRCVDFGASPGGWSWVLSTFGAQVLSIDKAPLAPSLQNIPTIQARQVSAFSIEPGSLGPIDWWVADIACYPERLLPWVKAWIASGTVTHMICTIKLQGTVDLKIIHQFQEIPDAQVIHLGYNKHELTLIWTASSQNF